MRAARTAAILTVAVALAACTPERGDRVRPIGSEDPLTGIVLLTGQEGIRAVRAPGGETLFAADRMIATPDGEALYRTTARSGRTSVLTIDPATGATIGRATLSGDWQASVASADGRALALIDMPRWDDLDPAPRSSTTILIADPTGTRAPERFELLGNFEPEAFSIDRRRLFMIQHVPALIPSAYRVAFLDLRTGVVSPVRGGFDTPTERMAGSRLEQLWRPDGEQLFTLYSNRPTRYAERTGGVVAPHEGVTFVHVLDVREGWAFCVGLPEEMGDSHERDLAMATTSDGTSLFVVDVRAGVVARMDTRSLQVPITGRISAAGIDAAVVSGPDDDILFVADSGGILRLDPRTLGSVGHWSLAAPPTALGLSADGHHLLAATSGGVMVVDASTGEQISRITVAEPFEIRQILAA